MSGLTDMWIPPEDSSTARCVEVVATEERICRCGTLIRPRQSQYVVADLPSSLQGLFDGRTFCSVACVRAFFLEALSEIDRIYTPAGEALVSDLRATYVKLVSVFLDFVEEWDTGDLPGGRRE